ncbi:MAG: TetR/AcrR family transcriptional regulator [Propionicimonas sp.]
MSKAATSTGDDRGKKGYPKGRVKKREILAAAMAMFAEAGYRGTSLREVAARVGLTHTGVLHHYPTKEALLQAVLAYRDEIDREWLGLADTSGLETLQRMVTLVGRNAKRRHLVELFCVLSAESTPIAHPAHDFFATRYRSIVKELTTAYEEVHEAGGLREGLDPQVAAQQFVAVMDGAQLQWLLDEASIDMVELVRASLAGQLGVSNAEVSRLNSVGAPPH